MRPLPTDRAAYRRLERRAILWTLVFGLAVVTLAVDVVGRFLLSDGFDRRMGVVPFLLLAAVLVAAWFVLRPMYREAAAARPVTLPEHPTPGQIYGMPELDDPPRRNRALSGEEDPPKRW